MKYEVNVKAILEKMLAAKNKRFQDETTKPTTDIRTNNWPPTILFETYISRLKKSWSDSNSGPLPPQAYSLPSG